MVQTCNYHPYIDEYIEMVESGKIRACKEQHQLIALVRKTLLDPNVYIDTQAIEDSVAIPKPYFPFELFPWQKFIHACVFGIRYKDTGRLVWNQILVLMGRGGGKNGYAGYLNFYMMSKKFQISNYNIEWVATSEQQAKITFEDVKNVLENPKYEKSLQKVFYKSKVLIQHKRTKSQMKFNTSNARTKDGLRPGAVFFDEIHEYEEYAAIKVFRSALGKIKDGRTFYLTTDGYVRGGVLDDLKEKSRLVLNGEVQESKLFPFICRLDKDEEVNDPENWEKANPSIRYNSELFETMREEWTECQKNIPMRVEFMTKRMNRPVADSRREVATYEDRLATDQPFPENLKGIDAVGGIDFADVRDFCSVGLLCKHGGKRYWMQHTFIHHRALQLQDINPDIIAIAKQKELCTIVYDKSIDADRVINWFLEKAKVFNIKKVACDSFRSSIMEEKFKETGMPLEIVRRGPVTHAKLAPLIDEMFIKQLIIFGDDPLMRWYVGNVFVDEKGNGNKEYCKIDKEKRKTDGFFAFTHALTQDSELTEVKPFTMKAFKVRTY
ncbi:terminase TerL endonuclease subunit [Bacillus mycoides]|uniref:terminase TerL endonuclease subunit n=1 Tax=Bacillus mycoides TaxID=1405 RepID=UPI0021122306|nr:terminase TerL endonuclease subunit [Bacillus mycoides]MCQ6531084.1 terminase large subunit [Bacillus mycoides]